MVEYHKFDKLFINFDIKKRLFTSLFFKFISIKSCLFSVNSFSKSEIKFCFKIKYLEFSFNNTSLFIQNLFAKKFLK